MARNSDLYPAILAEARRLIAVDPKIHAKEAARLIGEKLNIHVPTAQTYFYKAVKEIGVERPKRQHVGPTAQEQAVTLVKHEFANRPSIHPKEVAAHIAKHLKIEANTANSYAYHALNTLGLDYVRTKGKRLSVQTEKAPDKPPVTEANNAPAVIATAVTTPVSEPPKAVLTVSLPKATIKTPERPVTRVQTKPDRPLHGFTKEEMALETFDESKLPDFLLKDWGLTRADFHKAKGKKK
jgi:hypothetical protein